MHIVHGEILGDAVSPKVGIIFKEKLSVLTLGVIHILRNQQGGGGVLD